MITVALVLIVSSSFLIGTGFGNDPLQQPVIIDTDPGIDDAVAILTLLGDPTIQVLAITCVRGNTDVSRVVVNTLKILTIAQSYKVPVYVGSNFGLVESIPSDNYFGNDGFGEAPFPFEISYSGLQQEHAANFLSRIVREQPGEITVLALGPLTNIALSLHLNPDFLLQARRVVMLGGSVKGLGNVSPGVEFNFYSDPDAAAFVLSQINGSSDLVTLIPWETCVEHALTQDFRWKTLTIIRNSVVNFLNTVEAYTVKNHPSSSYIPSDLYAAAVILSPYFVTRSEKLYVSVENRGNKAQGVVLVDYYRTTNMAPNLEVVMDVNTSILRKIMLENLSNFH